MLNKSLPRCSHPLRTALFRFYSTPSAKKSTVQLIAELRKLTNVSISKAKEALNASNNSVDGALEWLSKDNITSGEKKAKKLEGRQTKEGLISAAVISNGSGERKGAVRAALVELNCETDFVARTDPFAKLAADISHTAAFMEDQIPKDTFFKNWDVEALYEAPLMPADRTSKNDGTTVRSALRDTILEVGESIQLRRATVTLQNPVVHEQNAFGFRLGAYVHGSTGKNPMQGRIGTLALLALKSPRIAELLREESVEQELTKLERALARQITGLDTQSVSASGPDPDETALYDQTFMMYPGDLSSHIVREALDIWGRGKGIDDGGIQVLGFKKWTVGEHLEEP